LLDNTVGGGTVEDKASLGLVAEAESEIVPIIPTLALAACVSEALLAVVAAANTAEEVGVVTGGADVESVVDTEDTPLKLDDWTGFAAYEFVTPAPAPRVPTRPPSVERAAPVFG
jgi:hypothetical protein